MITSIYFLKAFLTNFQHFTLCRIEVWIGMKVLQANSIILGTRKLLRIFPIKQKFSNTAAFFIIKMFKACQIWEYIWQRFLPIVQATCTLKTLSDTLPNLTKLIFFDYLKKLPWYQISAWLEKFATIFWCLEWLNWPARLSRLFRP